jgi:hypothetical protein
VLAIVLVLLAAVSVLRLPVTEYPNAVPSTGFGAAYCSPTLAPSRS